MLIILILIIVFDVVVVVVVISRKTESPPWFRTPHGFANGGLQLSKQVGHGG